jgi:hypothetical protein
MQLNLKEEGMRVIAAWILGLGLAVLTAMTGTVLADMPKDADPKPAQPAKAKAAKKAEKSEKSEKSDAAIAAELEELRQALQSQQEQLQMLKEELVKRDRQIDEAREAAAAANARAAEASSNASEAVTTTAEVKAAAASLGSTVSDLKASSEAHNSSVAVAAQYTEQGEKKSSPLSFKIGNADFTPGGFVDITSVNRTTNVGSGIGTNFGGIPFNNGATGRLTESRLTAQNSRVSLKVNSNTGTLDLTGYVESDFLGFQPPNANTTSNSNSMRLRLYFADVKRGKWEFQAGQLWTWMTPNRVGLSPMPSDIFYSQNMDTNYQVGLTWARQTAIRFAYHPTSSWAIGVSLENPQQFVPGSVTFPSGSFSSQFDNGSGSTSAASAGTNPAVPNLHPDIIVKSAWDAKVGDRNMHFEVAGLVRSFKVFNTLATPNATNSITGGGGSVNVNLELVKNFHVIGNSFYSYGGGRYIFGLGPDVIVRPDGTLSGVHSGSGIGGFEWQANPKYMLYGYYGGAYFQRNFGLLASSATPAPSCNGVSGFTCVGFGFPGSSNSANRAIQEGTIGFVPTLYSNPNYGKLQIITQYSYLTRAPWSVATGAPKNAHTNLIYADVRYTLP